MILISGMGELHLDIIVDRMKREFNVNCNVGNPQVAYRETIRGTAKAEGKFIREYGGKGQYGHVWLKLEPSEAGEGFVFVNEIEQKHVHQHIVINLSQSLLVLVAMIQTESDLSY